MKTPITDRLANPAGDFVRNTKVVHVSHAKKLELDRAALMEALRNLVNMTEHLVSEDTGCLPEARSALSAARANFPEP